jgi:hypothetical protein
MYKIALALALVVAVSANNFDTDVAESLQDFSVYQIGKDGQWSQCEDKTFAMVMDGDAYGSDLENMAKYCALYCRNFVDDDTTHVNIDDRSDKGGTYACYCSSDCDEMCEGTHTYESTTLTVESLSMEGVAYYYNTYYYSSYWDFPYIDDSSFGRFYGFNQYGPTTGYYTYYYYYYGTQYGGATLVLGNSDYSSYFEEVIEETEVTFDQWTIECDDGDMDFTNLMLEEQTPDYDYDDGTDTDYSSYTRFDVAGGLLTAAKEPKCEPVKIFQYGSVNYNQVWPGQANEANYMGLPEDTVEGVRRLCNAHTDQDSCEGYKLYSYGGYHCTDGGTSSTSENFGYSYYYDGTSIYHGDSNNCFDFEWHLQDNSYYGNTFIYYYYYYYTYIYVCDWTYDYEVEADVGISSFLHAAYYLYAVVDN